MSGRSSEKDSENSSRRSSGRAQNPYRQAIAAARPALVGVVVISAVINLLMLTGSIYMLQIYDRVLPGGSVPTLVVLFGIVVVLFAFLGFYDFLRARVLSRVALRIDERLGGPAFRTWLHSGLPGGGQRGGETEIMRDLDTVRGFLSGPAVPSMADLLFVPLFLGVLFLIHPWLGLLTIAGAGIGGILALINRAMTRKAIAQGAGCDMAERNFAERSHRSAETIQAMGMQANILACWQGLHRATLASGQAGSDPSEALAASSRAFRMLLQSAILSLGALLVIRGEISAGMIIASSILSGRALAPVDQLIGQWRTTGRAGAAHRRLRATFDAAAPEPKRISLPDPTGQITASGLTKLGQAAPGKERPRILDGIDFALEPGDAMGVIGNSASGKSTLARLLVGAGEGDSGEIRLDGATPDQWDPRQLGRRIGYLPQVLEMLPGTIGENIARFDPEAKDADVIAAATLTGIHEMILKLPEGYATQLCDPQSPPILSGGQMQRLGLARAVYGLPRIVVLDEPNANLDMGGDMALTRTIAALRAARSTVIVMAHRPSALEAVNKLMILDAGRVSAFGDCEDVLPMARDTGAQNSQDHVAHAVSAAPRQMPVKRPDQAQQAAIYASLSALAKVRAARATPKTKTPVEKSAGPAVVRMAGPATRRSQA